MTPEEKDQALRHLIHEATVPPGLRPRDVKGLKALLDNIGEEELSASDVDRMVAKFQGKVPLFGPFDTDESMSASIDPRSEVEEELTALHRAEGDEMSPEVKRMLEEFRKRAKEQDEGGGQ